MKMSLTAPTDLMTTASVPLAETVEVHSAGSIRARRLVDCAPIDPLWTAKESASFLQMSLATFWRRVQDGTIPPAVRLGGSYVRWPKSEIVAFLERAKADRFPSE